MSDKDTTSSQKRIEELNQRVIENQFFTPDNIYVDIGLFKDIPLGVIYADAVYIRKDEELFRKIQTHMLECIRPYQNRSYDPVDPYTSEIGYTDDVIDGLLKDTTIHDVVFMAAPHTAFIQTMVRHIQRNQNNSRPANKYTKKNLGNGNILITPMDVTMWINTYPLHLSPYVLDKLAVTFGESFGTNIKFVNKDPYLFDKSDWDTWLKCIDCFYFDSLDRFVGGTYTTTKYTEMELVEKYVYARKRFTKTAMEQMKGYRLEDEIPMVSGLLDAYFSFNWLQNNDVRLTEEAEDIPVEIDPISSDGDQ